MKILQVITSLDTGGAAMLVTGLVPLLQGVGQGNHAYPHSSGINTLLKCVTE